MRKVKKRLVCHDYTAQFYFCSVYAAYAVFTAMFRKIKPEYFDLKRNIDMKITARTFLEKIFAEKYYAARSEESFPLHINFRSHSRS
ncbi:Kinesin-like protein [Dirofilaria immitis]